MKSGCRTTVAVLFVCLPLLALAADAPFRPTRPAWREAARFLDLSTEQVARLQGARLEHELALRELAAQAQAASHEAARRRVCQASREREAAFRTRVTGLLTPVQAERLRQLQQAFDLMPLVEAAQAAGLLPASIEVPPAGLPEGSVNVAVTWLRTPARPLPGCPDTTVLREVSGEGEAPTRKPPVPPTR